MKLLLTGFQSFSGREKNGSETLVNQIELNLGTTEIRKEIFPVSWHRSDQQFEQLQKEYNPDFVISFGEGDPHAIKLETKASNEKQGIDEDQEEPSEEIEKTEIINLSTNFLLTEIPIQHFSNPIQLSDDPGKFLCNHLYFNFLQNAQGDALFIHLPIQGDQSNEEYFNQYNSDIILLIYIINLLNQNTKRKYSKKNNS